MPQQSLIFVLSLNDRPKELTFPINDCSSNRASLSSRPDFKSRFVTAWITLLSAVTRAPARGCKHRSDGMESLALGRAQGAADIYGFIQTSSTQGTFPSTYLKIGRGVISCRPVLRLPAEISAIDPHPVEDDRQFSGHRNRRLAMTLGFHEFDAPGFKRRPFAVAGDQGMGCDV